ncbi:hypothetical protein [Streptomyces adelaidensis]|uniref:hypothetical protein n=1 Tax=Streptomyces adelaidensis TaxID=2796465 RepID=UPI001902F79D|nr:hypothetical protein [Streptomyces adelaidensis]
MRPERFQAFALDVIKNARGAVRVRSLADAGDSKHPFGFAVTTAVGESTWQIMGQLADGERHEHQESPVEGAPAAWTDAQPGDSAEAWLAAAIGQAESPEISRIDRWSAREGAESDRQGLTVFFHDGSRAFVRML